jgi:hypothetical protein
MYVATELNKKVNNDNNLETEGAVIKNWNYTGLVEAFHNGEGKCYTAKVDKWKL